MKLDQQNYLVIGGSKGIGATIVNRLLNGGRRSILFLATRQ